MRTCIQCDITLATPQATAFQGGWRDKPQCRAWKACEARLGHKYDRYLNLIECTREDCPGGPQHPVTAHARPRRRRAMSERPTREQFVAAYLTLHGTTSEVE